MTQDVILHEALELMRSVEEAFSGLRRKGYLKSQNEREAAAMVEEFRSKVERIRLVTGNQLPA